MKVILTEFKNGSINCVAGCNNEKDISRQVCLDISSYIFHTLRMMGDRAKKQITLKDIIDNYENDESTLALK